MINTEVGVLPVPGAMLHFKLRGRGPLLLILPSGSGDADNADALADQLESQFTLLTYDRRGQSRSPLTDGVPPPSVEIHADDAHRLLAVHTPDPALVFGCSIGAIIGLELVIRHPGQVGTLVSHEASYAPFLDDQARDAAHRSHHLVDETYRLAGRRAAMRQLGLLNGADTAGAEPDLSPPRVGMRTAANADFFLSQESQAVRRYVMDVDGLVERAATTQIIPTAGRTSRHVWPHRCSHSLASRLTVPLTELPGGHEGYRTHPRGFAASLRDILLSRPEPPNLDQP
ncbi:alpha/beta hydrolase [Kribbella sp. NBC_00359]|uniref:alpha/beta hydrolase n=1 Tax=Kribbella sp. NBC_00359 TaxID=2975966 RepID=UPI002E204374